MPEHEGEERPGRLQQILSRAQEWILAKPAHVGYVVVIAALLLTVPFGGLAAAPEEELQQVPAGSAATAAPWEITLDRAIYGPELGGSFVAGELTHVLLMGTLRNTSERTVPIADLEGSLHVSGLPGAADPLGTPLEDGAIDMSLGGLYDLRPTPIPLRALVPGLDYPIGIHLTTTNSGALPEAIEVTLSTKTYRQSSLDSSYLWADPVSTAVLRVPTERSGPVFPSVWELEQ